MTPLTSQWSNLRAHTDNSKGETDSLVGHLEKVAVLAGQFAEPFGGGDLARLAGRLHDIGKVNPSFQEYLRRIEAGEDVKKGPPHAIWGAALAYWVFISRHPAMLNSVVLPVLGHHGGLSAASDAPPRFTEFLHDKENQIKIKDIIRSLPKSDWLRATLRPSTGNSEFFARMAFSALTDADFLATEAHFNPSMGNSRGGGPPLRDLWQRFDTDQARLFEDVASQSGQLNTVRREVYDCCLCASRMKPGLFRLRVPTGGGKTRSSLAFALQHALKHGLRRILVVLPYTSIIEQTAGVFRKALGADAVLEHHSQAPMADRSESQDESALRLRLAAENWDAPVVVTTTVQFFESLFSNRPAKVRKLHNVAHSVIVLDEAQALPVELLRPTIGAIQLLTREYGCTVVLCTATQPAFDETPYLPELANAEIHEIVPGYAKHFRALRRVRYEIRHSPLSWGEVAAAVKDLPQVMVVLNTRRDAIALLDAVGPDKDVFHLSTLLCGKHRRAVLRIIRCRLKKGLTVKLISTQVVEAGVDLDFPEVWRAVGPLDRIVQAAGRCNREGKMPNLGRVVVFHPADGRQPAGSYKIGCELARTMLERSAGDDLHNPDVYHEYFQKLYSYADLDKKRVQEARESLDFPEIASRYRMIDETVPAVVSHAGSETALKRWQAWPSRAAWRSIQPYLVNFFQFEAKHFVDDGYMVQVGEGLYRWLGRYDRTRGVVWAALDPADLIV